MEDSGDDGSDTDFNRGGTNVAGGREGQGKFSLILQMARMVHSHIMMIVKAGRGDDEGRRLAMI